MKKTFTLSNIICFLIFLYSVVHSFCFIFSGDDYVWFITDNIADLFNEKSPNGRYFTNFLTFFIIHYTVLRIIICSIILFGIFFILAKVLSRNNNDFKSYFISACTLLSVPPIIAALTINWMSGITNYVFSVSLTLVYILFCKPMFSGKKITVKSVWCIPITILAFLSIFTVENVSIYNIAFSFFIFIFAHFKKLRIHPANICYFIGSIVGFAVMFMNPNYSLILNDNVDKHGFRMAEFGLSDILFNIYRVIIKCYSKPFFVIHAIIAVSFIILYRKSLICKKNEHKYFRFCLFLTVIYTLYSFFTSCIVSFTSLTSNLRIAAIETAFTFIYLISLIYISYCLFQRDSFIRFVIWIVSTAFLIAPFAIVGPVTSRCFYPTYIFWCLASGEAFMEAFNNFKIKENDIIYKVAVTIVGCLSAFAVFIVVECKLVDNVRRSYFKKQYEDGSRLVEVISLPYSEYICDDFFSIIDDSQEDEPMNFVSYKSLLFLQMGIKPNENDKRVYVEVSTVDYFK